MSNVIVYFSQSDNVNGDRLGIIRDFPYVKESYTSQRWLDGE